MKRIITEELLEQYRVHLFEEEKSSATITKYLSDLRRLMGFADGVELTKERMIRYKEYLMNEKQYKSSSINSYLVAANRFFSFMGWFDLRVKTVRVQRSVFIPEERELTKAEFQRLVKAAQELGKHKLAMVIQTLCATGMRVSEIQFLTVAAVEKGRVTVYNKGKERVILIQRSLRMRLLAYIKKYGIRSGRVFCTANEKPLERSYIWREMKKLSRRAGVKESKVFPHNLRALFARTYYAVFKDIAKLADLLGHSSIETTRIYTKTSGSRHQKQLDKLKLLDGLGEAV